MSSFSLASLASLVLLVSSTLGHMALDQPPPLRAKNNPNYANGGNVDFDLTSPLSPSGSNFPCKGYLPDIFGASPVSKPVATLKAGSAFNVSFAGSASHGGGSCQFSLSYDQGKTWGVISEIVGGCPLQANVGFTVPQGVPGGEAVFAWTWFNRVGNREMYMNCAHVTVEGGNAPLTVSRMLEANVKGGPCGTVEGDDVDFAKPNLTDCSDPITSADKVTLKSGGGGGAPPAPAPTSTSTSESDEPTATSSAPEEEPTESEEPTETSTETPEPTETDDCPPESGDDEEGDDEEDGDDQDDEPTSSAPPADEPAPTAAPAPAPPASGGSGNCTNGAIICSADGNSWSMCSNGVPINMGSVAAGMTCVDGKHVAKVAARYMSRGHWTAMRRLERTH